MSDQFSIIHTDAVYDVSLKIVKRTREFVAITDYRNSPKEASQPTKTEVEVESIRFTLADKNAAIRRAINHLTIIGEHDDVS